MAYLCTDGVAIWSALYGWRVQYRGRYGKWYNLGLYCSSTSAEFAAKRIHGEKNTRIQEEYVGDKKA